MPTGDGTTRRRSRNKFIFKLPRCNCKNQCWKNLWDMPVVLGKLQYKMHNGKKNTVFDKKLMELIRAATPSGSKKYKLFGKQVCTAAFSSALGVSGDDNTENREANRQRPPRSNCRHARDEWCQQEV